MGIFSKKAAETPVFDAPTTVIDDISGDYTIDTAHTHLGFSARHAMVTKVRGKFNDFSGTAHIDTATRSNSTAAHHQGRSRSTPATPTATPTCAPATSSTTPPTRDHLRLAPASSATATIRHHRRPDHQGRHQAGDGGLRVDRHRQGPLRQHPRRLRGQAAINRSEWGLTFNAALETGGVLVSEKIKLEFDVSAIKTA